MNLYAIDSNLLEALENGEAGNLAAGIGMEKLTEVRLSNLCPKCNNIFTLNKVKDDFMYHCGICANDFYPVFGKVI